MDSDKLKRKETSDENHRDFAKPCYEKLYPGCIVVSDPPDFKNNLLDKMACQDRTLILPGVVLQVSERIRVNQGKFKDVITLRYTGISCGIKYNSEYYRLQDAYNTGGFIPNLYAYFGMDTRDVIIIDLRLMIKEMIGGKVKAYGPHSNADGSEFVSFYKDDLKKCGCVLIQWGEKEGLIYKSSKYMEEIEYILPPHNRLPIKPMHLLTGF